MPGGSNASPDGGLREFTHSDDLAREGTHGAWAVSIRHADDPVRFTLSRLGKRPWYHGPGAYHPARELFQAFKRLFHADEVDPGFHGERGHEYTGAWVPGLNAVLGLERSAAEQNRIQARLADEARQVNEQVELSKAEFPAGASAHPGD